MNESPTMTIEEVLHEKQARESNFQQDLEMANNIINNNPMILGYYWYLWNCRDREYPVPYEAEQMIRRMVEHMALPTEGQLSLLQQHLNNFSVRLVNHQLCIGNTATSAYTLATIQNPYTALSINVFDINDDNDRWLFVPMNILHEFVHCFEPVHVDLEDQKLLFCFFVNGRNVEESKRRTFEQGEIFEIMIF
jgi:hypothetical protein